MNTIDILETDGYQRWFEGLRDRAVQFRIAARLRRVSLGNLGDVRPVGESVLELRIDYGPGYRVYFTRLREVVIVLLAGGDRSSQQWDIERAKQLARGV